MEIITPCTNCVVLAVCRLKIFDDLIRDCNLLRNSLYWDKTTADGARSKYFGEKILLAKDTLNPETWDIEMEAEDINEDGFSFIVGKKCHDDVIDTLDSVNHVIVPKPFKAKKGR